MDTAQLSGIAGGTIEEDGNDELPSLLLSVKAQLAAISISRPVGYSTDVLDSAFVATLLRLYSSLRLQCSASAKQMTVENFE